MDKPVSVKEIAADLWHGRISPKSITTTVWRSKAFNEEWKRVTDDGLNVSERAAKFLMDPENDTERQRQGAELMLKIEAIRVQQEQIKKR